MHPNGILSCLFRAFSKKIFGLVFCYIHCFEIEWVFPLYGFLFKHIDLLEQDNERLRNLLRWKDAEGIFWKWMESVLEEKKAAVRLNDDVDDGTAEEAVIADYADRLKSSHCNLQQAILKYESIVEHLERLCANKVSS